MKGRSQLEVIYDILKMLKLNPPQLTTQLAFKVNITSSVYNTYFDLLYNMGLIQKIELHRRKVNYRKIKWEITNKGLKFIGIYEMLMDMMQYDNNSN